MRRGLAPLLVLVALVLAPPLDAQARWSFDLAAGYVSYEAISARVGSGSLLAGVRREAPAREWLYLYGGVPFDESGVNWGAAGAGSTLAWSRGRAYYGGSVGLHLLGYRDTEAEASGSGATLVALPLVGVRYGELTLELRSGLAQHTDFYEQERLTRRVHETGLQAAVLAAPSLRITGETRLVRAPEDAYPFAGGGAQLALGPVVLAGHGGRWFSDSIPDPAYGAAAAWQATQDWAVQASWQQEANDPLYGNLPRRTWSLGVSRTFGGARWQTGAAVVEAGADGRIAIRVPVAESPSPPALLGDFTGWQPLAMSREGEHWAVRLPLASGVYRYGFRDAEGRWFLPPSVTHRVDDGMGGESAVLIVP